MTTWQRRGSVPCVRHAAGSAEGSATSGQTATAKHEKRSEEIRHFLDTTLSKHVVNHVARKILGSARTEAVPSSSPARKSGHRTVRLVCASRWVWCCVWGWHGCVCMCVGPWGARGLTRTLWLRGWWCLLQLLQCAPPTVFTMSEWGERKTGASKAEVESGRWIAVQKRIFTRWANAYLKARKLKIKELTTDLQDGVVLINLLEILSGEHMHCKWRKEPKMEIHKRENLKTAFEFMSKHGLRLTNIGSVDVWDGNEKIILGLMWTIIAKFQVDEISVEGVSGKDALRLWCTHKTAGYEGVNVKNFHRSWKDGLAFCALIHKHRPDVVDFDSLSADSPAENLGLAFKLAEDYFGIDRILDVEDIVDVAKPDEKIVITYVAFIFKGLVEFLRRKALAKSIGKVM